MKAFIDWYNKQEPAKQDYIETIIYYLMRDDLINLIQEVFKYKEDFKIQSYTHCSVNCISQSVLRIKPIDPKHAMKYWEKEKEQK